LTKEEMVHDFNVIIRKSLNETFIHQYVCVIGKFVGLVGDKLPHSSSTKLREKAQRSKHSPNLKYKRF
jgi:hypothetical protein